MKNIDIDKIRLRKFGKYYFAGYGNISAPIKKRTFDKIGMIQARTLAQPQSAEFILSMIELDRNKLRKISKN
jgi:hypothetical protein